MLPTNVLEAATASVLGQIPKSVATALLKEGAPFESAARTVATPSMYAAHCALVVDGVARLYVSAPSGRQATAGYRRRGDFLVPLSRPLPPVRVQAMTACFAWLMPYESIQRAMSSNANAATAFARHMSAVWNSTIVEFRFGSFATVRQRVARHLLEIAVPEHSQPGKILIARLSARELADCVGTAREVVARIVAALARERALKPRADGYVILDAAALRAEFEALL